MIKLQKVDITDGLKEIEKELQQIIELQEKENTDLQQELDAAKADEEKAAQAVIEAKKGNDPKAYAQAAADYQTAANIVEFCSGRLEKLESKPLITEEEYNEYTTRIKDELDKITNRGKAKARELLSELAAIEPGVTININKGNDLLANLQHNIFKDDASMETGNGNRVRMKHLENRYIDYELTHNIQSIINSYATTSIRK